MEEMMIMCLSAAIVSPKGILDTEVEWRNHEVASFDWTCERRVVDVEEDQ